MPLLDAGSVARWSSAWTVGVCIRARLCYRDRASPLACSGTLANFAYPAGMGSRRSPGVRAFIGASVLPFFCFYIVELTIDLRTLSRREQLMLFIAVASNATLIWHCSLLQRDDRSHWSWQSTSRTR